MKDSTSRRECVTLIDSSRAGVPAPDAIYLNGLIWPGAHEHGNVGGGARADDSGVGEPTALAVGHGRVVGCGSTAEILELAGPGTEIIDLAGRRVVPGLIDGHIHAVRAGVTWDQELHWTGMPDVASALESIRRAAATASPGAWIRAVGGWHPTQFQEGRPPTRQELDEVSVGHPVYVQALYEVAVLNTAGLRVTGLDSFVGDPPGGVIQRYPNGEPTGCISGMGGFARCLEVMGARNASEQRESTTEMMSELHAAGLTGLVDPGGFGMPPERYEALFDLWRNGGLTMRMRLFVSAVDAGMEYQQLNDWLRHGQSQFGDDMLRLIGIGEVVHYGCHDFEGLDPSFAIEEGAREELLAISRRTAQRGWPMHIHAILDSSIDVILDCWETVNREIPLSDLRFSLAHADTISRRNIARLRALGAGVVVDDHLVFKSALSEAAWGTEAIRRAPPLTDLLAAGVPVAASTDATRASSYSPWLALWWLVAGHSLDGVQRRAPEQCMTRQQALHAYTAGSAWLSFEEGDRGHLHIGARADFAVLDVDYLTIPTDEIPAITSDLTVVGGRQVHASGAITASIADRRTDVADNIH